MLKEAYIGAEGEAMGMQARQGKLKAMAKGKELGLGAHSGEDIGEEQGATNEGDGVTSYEGWTRTHSLKSPTLVPSTTTHACKRG